MSNKGFLTMRTGLFFIFTICTLHAIATELAPLQAFRRLRQENLSFTGTSRMTNTPRLIKTFEEEGIKTMYALNDDEHTYIVTAQSEANPVVAILDHKLESIDSIPPLAKAIFENASRQVINQVHEAKMHITRDGWWTDPKWAKYPEIEPLLQSEWGQKGPFNIHVTCSKRGIPYRFLTGCGPTALAQIIRYHKYLERTKDPNLQKCSATYNFSDGTSITQEINIAEDRFEFSQPCLWLKMPMRECDATPGAFLEVSDLMLLCGHVCSAQYGMDGTGINFYIEKDALTKYFGYDKGATVVKLKEKKVDDIIDILYKELKNKRPVLFCFEVLEKATGKSHEGHDIVIDGYKVNSVTDQKTFYQATFHLNMGWAGKCNGLYEINNIIFKNEDGTEIRGESEYAIVGIQPPRTTYSTLQQAVTTNSSSPTLLNETKEASAISNVAEGNYFKKTLQGDYITIK